MVIAQVLCCPAHDATCPSALLWYSAAVSFEGMRTGKIAQEVFFKLKLNAGCHSGHRLSGKTEPGRVKLVQLAGTDVIYVFAGFGSPIRFGTRVSRPAWLELVEFAQQCK